MDREKNTDILELQESMHKFERGLDQLATDMRDIKTALLGNDYGDRGIVRRVIDNERQIEDLIEFKKRIYAYVGGVSAGVSIAMWLISHIF